MADKLDQLYADYEQLAAGGENIGQHETAYLSILSAVKGSKAEKQLVSQFIPKFFNNFPQHYDTAIDALLDLCEDEDLTIRRHAIRELPNICRQNKEYVPKMADVLAQLLQTEDNNELSLVNQSLTTVAKCDPKGFLGGLFLQIISGEDVVRERSIKFLKDRLKLIAPESLTKEDEEYFLDETRKVMVDVNKEEFVTFMTLLGGLKISKSLTGQQTLLEIVREQAELNTPLDGSDLDSVDKLLMCVRHAIPLFSQFVPSTDFVKYLCIQALPQLSELEAKQSGLALDFMQALAEMTPFVSPTIDQIEIEKCLTRVFSKLLEYMPTPPAIESIEDNVTANGGSEGPSLQFSHIECLLYTFQQLCRLNPQFMSSDAQSERVKDFKIRLQYVARGVQSYITKLRKLLATVKGEALKSEENKLRVMALKTTNNINTLIRDLFKSPPNFKSTIILSWKPPTAAKPVPVPPTVVTPVATSAVETETTPGKRKPITAPEGSEPKKERKIYAPPGGKFSAGMNRFSQNNTNRGGFRGGRGGGRGFRGGRGFKRGFNRW